jgi:aspartate/methionine/tyrosine aminotransferase
MTPNPMADFLARHAGAARGELAASDSETWRIADLLGLASDAQRNAWDDTKLGYTAPEGGEGLRRAIAGTYRGIAAADIVASQGAQEALSLIFEALLGPDDHAVIVLPTYPHTEHALAGRCAVSAVALDAERGWALDLERVAASITPRTRLMVVNFPNNPTGALLDAEKFDALVALCRRHGIALVNDEVYRLIDRDPKRRLPCVAEVYERGVSVDAVSKSLGLPGLRIGWIATRDADVRARIVAALHWRSSCPATPSEILAEVALANRELLLARNRALALANLAAVEATIARHSHRLSWTRPEGSVVGYVRCRGDVEAFAERLAAEHGVLVLPASIWQSARADLPRDHFRLGFGRRDTQAALAALEKAL